MKNKTKDAVEEKPKDISSIKSIKEQMEEPDYQEKFLAGIEHFKSIMCKAQITSITTSDTLDQGLFYLMSGFNRRPVFLGKTAAAVTCTDHFIELLYNPIAMLNMTAKQIEFVLLHELGHIVNKHFTRGEEIAAQLNVPLREFYKTYAPYADLPVNKTLQEHESYQYMVEDYGCMTYNNTQIPSTCDTFEKICHYIKNNKQKQNDKTVVVVSAGGATKVIGDPNASPEDIIVISESPNNPEHAEKELSDAIESTSTKLAGQGRSAFGTFISEIEDFIKASNKVVDQTWEILKNYLVQLGTSSKIRQKSARRLNKKTLQPKGRIKSDGYNVMMIVDESGSMPDVEVNFLLQLAQKSALTESNDNLYIARWCTDLVGDVQKINSYSDALKLRRKGNGGTNFSSIFTDERIIKHNVDAYIFATDGEVCGDWPKDPPFKPILYLITSEEGVKDFEQNCKYGNYMYISSNLIKEAVNAN